MPNDDMNHDAPSRKREFLRYEIRNEL